MRPSLFLPPSYWPPPVPSVGTPGGNSFEVTWGAVAGATGYRLDVATDKTFSSLVTGYNNLTVEDTSKDVTDLELNTDYWVRLRAVDGVRTSPNSKSVKTLTGTVPDSPVAHISNCTNSAFNGDFSLTEAGTVNGYPYFTGLIPDQGGAFVQLQYYPAISGWLCGVVVPWTWNFAYAISGGGTSLVVGDYTTLMTGTYGLDVWSPSNTATVSVSG